ncbi:MAG TPA: Uma2 family endonuclease [Pseudonocardiaceae bacterium]
MTTVMTSPRRLADFTLDDWDRLEPDEGQRVELVDGQFRVSAAPTPWHQIICDELRALLVPAVKPLGWRVVSAIGIRVRPKVGYIPDLVVCEPVQRGTQSVTASAVAVTVEVVSPSSRKNDRFEKPVAYALAGIPAYWRAEIVKDHLISVHCYQLDENGVYVEHATAENGKPATITLPIGAEITIDIEALDR